MRERDYARSLTRMSLAFKKQHDNLSEHNNPLLGGALLILLEISIVFSSEANDIQQKILDDAYGETP